MQERTVTIPELILIAGTRVALGVGIGLLIADKLTDNVRGVISDPTRSPQYAFFN